MTVEPTSLYSGVGGILILFFLPTDELLWLASGDLAVSELRAAARARVGQRSHPWEMGESCLTFFKSRRLVSQRVTSDVGPLHMPGVARPHLVRVFLRATHLSRGLPALCPPGAG